MPERMENLRRTGYCGEFTENQAGSEVVAAGFVHKVRDFGNLCFIDLRDRTGIVQLVLRDGDCAAEQLQKAGTLRAEFVVMARGTLRLREQVNPDLPTGGVEIAVRELRVLSEADVPPFEIANTDKVGEELRLRYRYLDLRSEPMQRAIVMRHRIVKAARDYFDRCGFLEIETPALIRSTPEGARDYLVPSRVHPGEFYALPQSPQLYKQLLMLAGYDRYMQVVRCFRDEDLRADRQPEFTQIDLEMSFSDREDVIAVNEGFLRELFHKILGVDIALPLRRIPYADAMRDYGSDKPDTRFGLKLIDLTDTLRGTGFAAFAVAIAAGGSVRGIRVPGGAEVFSRKEIDKLTDLVKTYKAKGLAYTRLLPDGTSSSFEKFLTDGEIAAIHGALGAEAGDLLLIVADSDDGVVFDALGALRLALGRRLSLIPPHSFDLLWVTDFPQFEKNDDGTLAAKHHPFTAPLDEHLDRLERDPGSCVAKAYDIIINGTEIGGGSVRITDPAVQARMFKALGFTPERAKEQFGFLLEAFRYGVPPHAGMAYGLDRLCMLLLERESIRDVIAFPKVQNARELMIGSPGPVEDKQLDELSIRLNIAK